ncbi:suppressor of fused domain protein [Ruminococcus sp.]|uniref:suppressor of fused domain protein n=1 Tax=Ruminococcus sp. TaxID=41978 RepID=UPI0039947798
MEQEQNAQMTPELYTEEQLDAVETHITRWFGEYPTVLHEVFSPDIHVDICIIPPSPERNWVTLVTEGMGAHRMHVPEDPESAPPGTGRAAAVPAAGLESGQRGRKGLLADPAAETAGTASAGV